MSSKFFTNEDNNTLLNKIEGIFKYRNIHFFDALTGYFRASGYFRIRPFVDKYAKMMKHNGFFLSDVVGLGKTAVATLIAKKFFYSNGFPSYLSKTLVICPPALKENWDDTLSQFGLHDYKIITSGSLHKVTKPHDYDLVIVDEAHKFRNDTAGMYTELQKICKTPTRKKLMDDTYQQKRVMLVSATPLNNRPEDIANQVYLFQDAKDSIPGISNLQNFFRKKIDEYKKLKHEPDIKKWRKASICTAPISLSIMIRLGTQRD